MDGDLVIKYVFAMHVFFYILASFQGWPWVKSGKLGATIGFDDMCHMGRFAERRRGISD